MTTKQIAEYLGKPEKTVRTWAASASAKSAEAAAKMAEASPTHPADWDLDETCKIIEEGMGPDVAAVYRTNAVNAEMQLRSKRTYSAAMVHQYRMTYGTEATKELLAELGFGPPKGLANVIPFPSLPAPGSSEAEYLACRELLGDSGTRQVLAVACKAAEKYRSAKETERAQGKLGL